MKVMNRLGLCLSYMQIWLNVTDVGEMTYLGSALEVVDSFISFRIG